MEPEANFASRRLDALAAKVFAPAAGLGVLGLAGSAGLGAAAGWDRFFQSYLVAFLFVLSIALGALFFTFIKHLTRAGWSVVLRRILEALGANLSWLWVLFVPLLLVVVLGHGEMLYHWADTEHAAHDELLQHKAPYLNTGFWAIRAIVYLAVWAVAGEFFFRLSTAQDRTGDVHLTKRMQRWSPVIAVLFALTQTFAAVDWIKSLEPHWFSTMFGVYFFAASTCGVIATLCLVMYGLQRAGKLEAEITQEHYQDVGKMLFAFGIVFWAYIAFSQYMLIWYANIPEETMWYLARQLGPWLWVSVVLLLGHFLVPFVLLLSKHPKRIKPVLAGFGAWMLLMHYLDLYWLVMPQVPADAMYAATSYAALADGVASGEVDVGFEPHMLDVTTVVVMAGVFVAMTVRRLRACALIPVQDPRLHESLAFENM